LLANITLLQKETLSLQNPTATLTIFPVDPILIGPPPSSQIAVTPNGATFEYNGTIFLIIKVFVSTPHQGALTIPHGSLSLNPTYNASQIWIGFSTSGISSSDYFEPINVASQELSINMSCRSFYRFTNSEILKYQSFDIGYVDFSVKFTDTFANYTITKTAQAPFRWNNSTVMP
jgi:hypothetical protein